MIPPLPSEPPHHPGVRLTTRNGLVGVSLTTLAFGLGRGFGLDS
jgi:hypothetical protein